MKPGKGDVLLVIDVQNDFCPGGGLAVPDGDSVVPDINRQLGLIWASLIDAIWDTVQLLDEIERTHGHKLLPGPVPFLDGPPAQLVVPDALGALPKFLAQRFLGNALDAPAI